MVGVGGNAIEVRESLNGVRCHGKKRLICKQKIKKNCSDAVYRKPGAVQKAAVCKAAIFYEKDGNLPEKSPDGAQEEKENLLGDKQGDMILLRWAEFGEIRQCVVSFHGDSVPQIQENIGQVSFRRCLTNEGTFIFTVLCYTCDSVLNLGQWKIFENPKSPRLREFYRRRCREKTCKAWIHTL